MAEDKVKCCYDDSTSEIQPQEVLEEMINEIPGQQDALTSQIDQVTQQKDKIDEQIQVLETCIEDCVSNLLEGTLHTIAKAHEAPGIFPMGRWKDDVLYSDLAVVVSSVDPSTYGIYKCKLMHQSSSDTKPPTGPNFSTYWEYYAAALDHPSYTVYKGPNYNNKQYGNNQTDWKIVDSTTGLIVFYAYESGPWWNTWHYSTDIDVRNMCREWADSNEMVTAPLGVEGFYGLKALSDALDKAKTGLTNSRTKITNMVPVLSRFI